MCVYAFQILCAAFAILIACPMCPAACTVGWTKSDRPLEFHREEFLSVSNRERDRRMLMQVLNGSTPGWPPERMAIRWPKLRRVIVYDPSDWESESIACNFDAVENKVPTRG